MEYLFADIKFVLQRIDLNPLLFADDLIACKLFSRFVGNDVILELLHQGQTDCHNWGAANQVKFEASKDTFTIIGDIDPHGPGFKLL